MPPKVTFPTISGMWILPISVPSGSKQCTPSPALDQMRPYAMLKVAEPP